MMSELIPNEHLLIWSRLLSLICFFTNLVWEYKCTGEIYGAMVAVAIADPQRTLSYGQGGLSTQAIKYMDCNFQRAHNSSAQP